uniref:DDE_Tnp_Tn3 domain-containing protein n=1 Tax=Heterorhabditis bacteriophora TaxID=37862 RepID=A0A1I7X4I3_HETBA
MRKSYLTNILLSLTKYQEYIEYIIELADATRTSLYGYLKWQNDHMIHKEQSFPAFDDLDDVQNMMLGFGTLFCDAEGAQIGSPYEAM